MTEVNVIISIGTNVEPNINMFMAKQRIERMFRSVQYSSEIWTEAVDLPGADKFLNCLAYVRTAHGLKQVHQALKQVERKCGVSQAMKNAGMVKLDIDILQYGDERFHEEDWKRSYVKYLMEELKGRIATEKR